MRANYHRTGGGRGITPAGNFMLAMCLWGFSILGLFLIFKVRKEVGSPVDFSDSHPFPPPAAGQVLGSLGPRSSSLSTRPVGVKKPLGGVDGMEEGDGCDCGGDAMV